MKNWFTSLRGAIILSALALISEAWRGFLDAMFVLPVDIGDEALLNLAAILFTLLFGGWTWSLVVAGRGGRGGLIAAFVVNLFVLLVIPVSWLFFYCPTACRAEAGVFNLANSLNLLFGTLAAISLAIVIKRHRSSRSGANLPVEGLRS